jgi:Spy/CpxP family protein refolding chaperone
MKHTTKIVFLSLAISSLLLGQSAFAESVVPAKQEAASETPKKCDKEEHKGKRLEALKTELKLNASQETAWNEWAAKIKGDHEGWEEKRKEMESWASLTVPERMEKKIAFSKEHIAKQEERLAATKTFYVVLTPEQRQIFDKGFMFEHHGGGKHDKK